MYMTREQKKKYVKNFVNSGEDIQQVDWKALGYNSPISAQSGFDIVLKRYPYNCRMITRGIKVYLITDEYYNLHISSERYWVKFKLKLLQSIELGSGVLKVSRDMFPKMNTFALTLRIKDIIRECGYTGLYVDVDKDYISIWKTDSQK